MDDWLATKRLIVVFGVLASSMFGVAVGLFTEKREQIEEIKIVYVPEGDRGPAGPPGPTEEQVDRLVDDYCSDGRCGDRR